MDEKIILRNKIIQDLEKIYSLCMSCENFTAAIQAKKAIASILAKKVENISLEELTNEQLEDLLEQAEENEIKLNYA